MDRIRIGAVSYLNTRPLVWGMEHGFADPRVELSYAVPSVLAERMAAGALDLALIPIIALADMPELEIVPGLSIVTHGETRSVLLVSRKPPEQIETLALDRDSRTSNVLARVLLDDRWGRRPHCERGPTDLTEALSTSDAVVRIGDKALFEPLPAELLVHDLGTLWTERTGLPFVFAAWCARPGVVDRTLYRSLHDSRRRGSNAIREISEEYSWNGRRDPETAQTYLTRHIRYRLGAAEVRAMKRFFEAAQKLGLIEAAPPIRLALQRWTTCHETAANRGLTEGRPS